MNLHHGSRAGDENLPIHPTVVPATNYTPPGPVDSLDAAIPPGEFAIGDDYVLGVWRDEQAVERVLTFAVSKPSGT